MVSKALGCIGYGYSNLPPRLRLWLGSGLGCILRCTRIRARVIRENLLIAYSGEANVALRGQLFVAAYRHLGLLVFEVMMVFAGLKRFVKTSTEMTGFENWKQASNNGKGVFFLSSHVGNWEIMAAAGAEKGMPLMLVTKKLKPAWFHAAMEKGRAACGVLGTYEPRTLRDVLAHLNKGGTVGFVLDQYAGHPVGVRVPFMGLPVGTAAILAVLAKRTGAPVLPVVNYRLPTGSVRVEIGVPLNWIADIDSEREIALNTAKYAAILEQNVRDHPEQWLWTHRRFKGDLSPLRPDEWSQKRQRH